MDLRGKRMGEKIMASDINLGGFLSLVSCALPPITVPAHCLLCTLSPFAMAPPFTLPTLAAFSGPGLCSGKVCG